eukprot:gene13016-14356_t
MVGMAFDGASSMKCLARLMKQTISQHAMYFHCFAHCNELVFKDATSLSPLVETSHNELQEALSQLKEDSSVTPTCRSKARGLLKKYSHFRKCSTSDFVAYSQAPIESTDIGERNVLQANFYEAIDATSQAPKDRFDQEDLKTLLSINKCLIPYEKAAREQRMRTEISQAKKEASFYLDNVEKGKVMTAMEKRKSRKRQKEGTTDDDKDMEAMQLAMKKFKQRKVVRQAEEKSGTVTNKVGSSLLSKVFGR